MAKLIRRHPHVFGDVEAASADAVVERWHAIKRDERGGRAIGDLAKTLPALVRARKLQERARRGGLDDRRDPRDALASAARRLDRIRDGDGAGAFEAVGAALLEVVEAAAGLGVDPELALSATAEDYRRSVEAGAR
jgi:uncharacterized protein YabN with tetrapyrrole methylase and pyrophosphatase domain